MISIILVTFIVLIIFGTIYALLSRYKRCPSDKILVVYGKVGNKADGTEKASAKCIHGGAAFIWPVFQSYEFLELRPISQNADVKSALSKQNIRLDVKTKFTVGISTEPSVMANAAERLLGQSMGDISQFAHNIVEGQLRQVIAIMSIEEINADRDKFQGNIQHNVENELKKIGLKLININIVDIQDESGYIKALGQEAAAKAINDAKKSVAEKDRDGAIGEADANQDKITQVSKLHSQAEIGRAEAEREQRIKKAEANATAIEGENKSEILIAGSEAKKRESKAEADRLATTAEKVAKARANQDSFEAQTLEEVARAKKEKATQEATIIVNADIAKRKQGIEADAQADVSRKLALGEADSIREIAKGEADAIYAKMSAEAKGQKEILDKKAEGFKKLVDAAGGDAKLAIMYLMNEQAPEIYKINAEAIKNIKIDKITVWDSQNGSATPNFLQGLFKMVPPLKEVFESTDSFLPGWISPKPEATSEVKETLPNEGPKTLLS